MNREKSIGFLDCFSLFARSSFMICYSSHKRDCVLVSSLTIRNPVSSIRYHSERHCHPLINIIGAWGKEQFGGECELSSSLHVRGCYDQAELC